MVDVADQRSERKKWIHSFESVTSTIFCAACSEYDQVLLEEKNRNRMMESLTLFESVINYRWFLGKSIILFLRPVLPKVPLERYFPEYSGGADVNKGAKYILGRFIIRQATDTTNLRLLVVAVKETYLHSTLEGSEIS
ncbi:G-alpha-domain-containing protein [Stereum hirsutum FP-91666 SS1]|uniref:G-alpha-domain-containing protein n=1 Tax=Stereum hirsutum (strain FP-91666) TaxID=721885 RepID=R7RZQ2_STEHR|nr:G-alpha-domain-containing protein [Stereum hirsutum FP-91666 SS1]EIM79797.1 G-alpha-domain-containing protein [Stereum hirsutum FP-91666 SS1]